MKGIRGPPVILQYIMMTKSKYAPRYDHRVQKVLRVTRVIWGEKDQQEKRYIYSYQVFLISIMLM